MKRISAVKTGFSRSVRGGRLTGYLQKKRLGWELRAGRASSPRQGFIVLAEVMGVWGKADRDCICRGLEQEEKNESRGLEVTPLGD